jgi:putative DNA primase/helicase
MMAKVSAMLAPALAYAARGFHVLACKPRGKQPLTKHGLHDATTNAGIITQRWTATPNANIAIACAASGLVVIDVDQHVDKKTGNLVDGEATFAALKAELGPLPETVEARTGGGGRHLVFAAPKGAEFRGGLGTGLDIKHDGYILVAPSIHPDTGQLYRWVRSPLDQRPAPLPEAWLARMVKPTAPVLAATSPPSRTSMGSGSYGLAAVAAELEEVRTAPEGERNNQLNRSALALGSLYAGGECTDVREEIVAAAMSAGLPEAEARKTLESGWRAGLKKPRTRPAKEGRTMPKETPPPSAREGELEPAGDVEAPPAENYRFGESEAARRFGDIIRDRARFAADDGQWYYFDGKRWVKDLGGVWMLEQSLKVSRAYAEYGIRHGSNDPQFQARMAMAKAYNGLPGRKRLIELVRAEPGLAILSSQFDADPWLFTVANGTIDLRTRELRPHNAGDLVTKISPANCDPAAKCPRWDLFLAEVIPDIEARAYFQRMVGYFLSGDVSAHKLFFCYGTGANGKSVVLEVLLALLGDHGTLAPVSLLMAKPTEQHPCDRMVLRGRRLAVFAETPAGQRWDESTVKALTGGDTITARGMRENFSTFTPSAKFAIAGNHRPRVNDLSEGFWRRFEEIPFEVTIPEDRRDHKLADTLRAELSGILNFALEGFTAWQHQGLGKSAKVQAATGAYRAESDRLAPFLAERCTLAPGNRISRAALRTAYEAWCSQEGEHPITPRDFTEQLRQRDVTEAKVNSARGWRGIGLVDLVHEDTSGQQFPVNRLEESSRGSTGKVVSQSVLVSSPADAPRLEKDVFGRLVPLPERPQ